MLLKPKQRLFFLKHNQMRWKLKWIVCYSDRLQKLFYRVNLTGNRRRNIEKKKIGETKRPKSIPIMISNFQLRTASLYQKQSLQCCKDQFKECIFSFWNCDTCCLIFFIFIFDVVFEGKHFGSLPSTKNHLFPGGWPGLPHLLLTL